MMGAAVARLVIVGGGITGLVAALLAARAGREVTVLEAGPTFGGLLDTFEIGGGRRERYYHHFFTHDAEIHWLIDQLGLGHRLTYQGATMGIFRDGAIPFGTPNDLLRFPPLGPLDKLRFALSSAYLAKLADWRAQEETPAIAWLRRFAGEGATRAIWRPMLDIRFGPHADEVPLSWLVGRMRQRGQFQAAGRGAAGISRRQPTGSAGRAAGGARACGRPAGGDEPAVRCRIRGGRLVALETAAGAHEDADFLFTLPTTTLARLLRADAPDEAARLERIRYFGAVCTVLELTRPSSGIYWLNVADPGFPFGAVIEQTGLVDRSAYGSSHVAYLSRYLAQGDPLLRASEDEVVACMLPPLERIFPDLRAGDVSNVFVFRTGTAAPVCDLGFSRKVPPCRGAIERLYVATMCHV
jgi:protoporphyrinogen oxidase